MNKSYVLVGVSTPEVGQKLVEPLKRLANRLDAKVLLIHVTSTCETDEQEEVARIEGEEALSALASTLNECSIETNKQVLHANDIAACIVETAFDNNCSLIVLGLTGQQVLSRLIAGDVPSNIIRKSQIPVLLYPVGWQGDI